MFTLSRSKHTLFDGGVAPNWVGWIVYRLEVQELKSVQDVRTMIDIWHRVRIE